MNKLNQEYFKTRKKHKENYEKPPFQKRILYVLISIPLILLTKYGLNVLNDKGKQNEINAVMQSDDKDRFYSKDTVFENGKYFKLFKTDEAILPKRLFAEFGTGKDKFFHKMDDSFSFRNDFSSAKLISTQNTCYLIDGCGTNCTFAVVYDFRNGSVQQMPIWDYPNGYKFISDDFSYLILPIEEKENNQSRFILFNTESKSSDTIDLPIHWNHGVLSYYSMVKKVEFSKNLLKVYALSDNDSLILNLSKNNQ